ncbi:conserved protein of unknown function [Pararobbsia alpina]|uniref:glycoside hydrolase family 108 protein n=1 Tax=Pararobbsia alpina TaxID=621374 RepID=UPI0039A677B7
MILPDDLIDKLLPIEGGYTDDPNDAGGETNFGITIAVARAFGYTGDMRAMPRATAVEIYRARYWTQPRFGQVSTIDPELAAMLFDIGVNMGTATGVMFLQRALNVLNKQGTAYPDIALDGGVGAMTIAALTAFKTQRGAAGLTVLRSMVNAQRSVRYIEIAEHTYTNENFEFGWQQRTFGDV